MAFDIKDLSGLGSAFEFGSTIIERFFPKDATAEDKARAIKEMVPILEARDDTVTNAQRDIIVAEMAQQDNFTKRARPMVVYCGLAFIFLVHVLVPCVIKTILMIKIATLTPEQIVGLREYMSMTLPGEFWMAWGSVVSVWSIGRTFEKNGATNKIVSMLTGGNKK